MQYQTCTKKELEQRLVPCYNDTFWLSDILVFSFLNSCCDIFGQGIVVFASVMATLGLQILFESGREIITKV